ncbi:MAG: GSU2403 family nucleotidyltransferase fold protein [Betaproteobacteria bacterium]
MDYIALSDNAARQVIDSTTIFDEFVRVRKQARPYVGGMYWKRQGDYEYLVKTSPDNRQSRVGPRSPATEKIYDEFTARKREYETRLKSLRAVLTDAERLNKALKAGRVPSIVVSVLQTLEDAGLGQHFTVVGTHALYAYETAAGVRIVQGALATQDVDLLWDARKRVRFITDLGKLDSSVLHVLQRADATFLRKEGQNETAINAKGFEVDFLRRQPEGDDPHPFRFSDDEDDLWPVQAVRASVLTNAPRFEHMVISATGRMTLMRTITPESFIEFKRWMAAKAPQRLESKRRRDLRQADIVQGLLDEGLLMPMADRQTDE